MHEQEGTWRCPRQKRAFPAWCPSYVDAFEFSVLGLDDPRYSSIKTSLESWCLVVLSSAKQVHGLAEMLEDPKAPVASITSEDSVL